MAAQTGRYDFSAVHAAMRRYVDAEILPGVSSAVLVGRDLTDLHCAGWADREAKVALREDHIFRVFSNTKLVTSCALLMLYEEGRIGLDDPVERFLPQLAKRRVLRPGATTIDDTEPARGPITIRHLMSHSSGLSYGLLDPGTLIYQAYAGRRVLNPLATLAQMIDALEPLPLVFHPGGGWEYSVATDVLARVVEVISDQRFDAFIQSRILAPLGMNDTSFVVPEDKRARFTAYYAGADVLEPMKPGLTRTDDAPYAQAYLRPAAKLSGGGGLVSTLPDMIALVRSLLPGGTTLLKPATIALMMTNQLPENIWIRFPRIGEIVGKGHGLAGAVTLAPSPAEPAGAVGEFQWGGLAGTHWWISPRQKLAGLLMTQRQLAFWHPFSFEFKQLVYRAVGR
ncbi:MAG TPA: serine hydrolase domain-containing protein [Burkholderiales bacterium]|nr:serine hydrolase domain-containing protein [Burkholderiales bacterium]